MAAVVASPAPTTSTTSQAPSGSPTAFRGTVTVQVRPPKFEDALVRGSPVSCPVAARPGVGAASGASTPTAILTPRAPLASAATVASSSKVIVPVATPTIDPVRSMAGTTMTTPSPARAENLTGRLTARSNVEMDSWMSAARAGPRQHRRPTGGAGAGEIVGGLAHVINGTVGGAFRLAGRHRIARCRASVPGSPVNDSLVVRRGSASVTLRSNSSERVPSLLIRVWAKRDELVGRHPVGGVHRLDGAHRQRHPVERQLRRRSSVVRLERCLLDFGIAVGAVADPSSYRCDRYAKDHDDRRDQFPPSH